MAVIPTACAAATFWSESSTNAHSSGATPSREAASRKISAPGLAMHTSARHQIEMGPDGPLRKAPLLVERRQRLARAGLELGMGPYFPRLRIADAALDVVPRLRAVQRLDHGRAWQPVLLGGGARHLPPHVPEDTAEVEDDGAEANSAERSRRAAFPPASSRCRRTAAPSRAA